MRCAAPGRKGRYGGRHRTYPRSGRDVYADVGYTRFTADADCVKSLGCGVTAMQETQHLLIKCLHAHAYAVDPDGMQCGYELRRYVIGITLYGEFLKVFKADDRVYG